MAERRKAAVLTYDDLLNEALLNIDLARESGQHAAAFKGLAMLGSEMFEAFVQKRETNINLDVKITSKAQLRAALVNEYGEELAANIWQHWSSTTPKLIEHDPNNDANDVTFHGAETSDSKAQRGHPRDSAKATQLAMESLQNSKAPKV
jgi:hypothetical protein